MPASAEKLLDLLEDRRLLPQTMIDSLRRQVAAAPEAVTAHHVAKILQRKGKITAFQARELLAEVEGRAVDVESGEPTGASPEAPPADDDELGLADDGEPKRTALKSSPTPAASPARESASAELDAPAALSDGLDSLLDDPLMQSPANPLQPVGKKTGWGWSGKKRGKRVAAGWDSPLIIVGGGVLLLLLMIGAVLAFVLTRGSGDELFAAAEQDYLDGAYGQAIGKFERFVDRHGSHPDVSMARVRIALAKLRIETTSENWPQALQRAQEVLPEIAAEPALGQARPELSALLPDIVEGLSQRASAETDVDRTAEMVAQFYQALEIVNDPTYLPASQRAAQSGKIERSSESIAAVVRTIEEQSRLKETISDINALAGGENAMQAYGKRDELLKLYPRLHDHAELSVAISAVSDQLADRVQLHEEVIAAVEEERPSPIVAEVALADVSGEEIAALKGHIASFVIDGVLHVLQADTGRLLWRRFVGRETISAVPVSSTPGADVLVADTQHHDLLRLRGSDGQLVWRLPVGSSFQIVAGPEQVWLAIDEGALWDVDPATGNCERQIRFPQPLASAPCMTESGRIIQVADHSNVYVLNSDTLKCESVYYLGHARAAVRYSPVAAAGIVVVPHQVGLRRSLLHVLRETAQSPLAVAQTPIVMDGQFGAPLVGDGLHIATIDQSGKLTLRMVDPAKQDAPLETVAETAGGSETMAIQVEVRDGYLIVGANRLAAYRLANARGNLSPRWINHNGDNFVAPLQLLGDYVLHARRSKGRAGVIIAATARDADEAQDAGRPVWENVISPGAPTSSWQPSADGESLVVQSALGHAYEISLDIDKPQALNDPTLRALRPGDYRAALALDARRAVLVAAGQPPLATDHQAVFFETPQRDLSTFEFENAALWREGLLTPSKLGRVEFLQTKPELPALFPFQPKLELGTAIQWLRPAVVNDQQVAIANRRGDLYLVGIENGGAPHLAEIAQANIPLPPIAAPLVFGEKVVVVTRGQRQDTLVSFELPSLSGESQASLPGRLRWGPYVVGESMLLATIPGDLQAYGRQGQLRWTFPLEGKLPVGAPAHRGDELAVAMTDGHVVQMTLDTGELIRETDVAQPLVDGPLYASERIALRGSDGSVLFVAGE